jgi:4-aminobutyrate aminotransferase-like enzyme
VSGTSDILRLLRAYESPNVTFVELDGSWPIVWERAKGVHVWDADGKKYLDLTAAFGVAATGHGNPRVVKAGQQQMARLLHAMGDVHPPALKAELARELSRMTFERWSRRAPRSLRSSSALTRVSLQRGKTIFCNSGFEAVEAALKTAMLVTGKRGIIAFEGAYHGAGYGALNATHREHFRRPFRSQLGGFAYFVPFPRVKRAARLTKWRSKSPADRQDADRNLDVVSSRIRTLLRREKIGAILVEPIQGRGGINVPPPEFLPLLRQLCDERGALLILDEIYTGFGRTGKWFASEHTQTTPDLVCLGKALTGGFPLSACVGRADLMDAAWPASTGEAIHTSTFLGHPVGCAMALAQIREIEDRELVKRSATLGTLLLSAIRTLHASDSTLHLVARGVGLMAGLELRRSDGSPATQTTMHVIKTMLRRGFILLPEGEAGNVISFTPPFVITKLQLADMVAALREVLITCG